MSVVSARISGNFRSHGSDWRDEAACSSSADTSLFFPVGVTGLAELQIDDAKAVCRSCPVRETCLEFAITTNQEYGVWGGTGEDERRDLRRAWRAEHRATREAMRAARAS